MRAQISLSALSKNSIKLIYIVLVTLAVVVAALGQASAQTRAPGRDNRFFSSFKGREHAVSFQGVYRTDETALETFTTMSDEDKNYFVMGNMLPLMDYLFGPLVERALAGPQRTTEIVVDWANAKLVNGVVELPYTYKGLWIIFLDAAGQPSIDLPLPYNRQLTFTPNWKNCTDSNPEHQTEGFYWYFYEPSRPGCDQVEGTHYQTVKVTIGKQTPNQTNTTPEYDRMLSNGDMTLTIAFGYVSDPADPNPATDVDAGISEFRKFLRQMSAKYPQFKTEDILQKEYKSATKPELVIGRRYTGEMNGAKVVVNVVAAAGIDQMELFAKSYAHDHDDLFAWFGHSRVGSGFDAQRFGWMVEEDPSYYSISTAYQVIYWGGCNSYSYYTLAFFDSKKKASTAANIYDPNGTKNLDIIANGLPSYFMVNAYNAGITVDSFLNWTAKPTYQKMIEEIEKGIQWTNVLVAVLGDEDNGVNGIIPEPR